MFIYNFVPIVQTNDTSFTKRQPLLKEVTFALKYFFYLLQFPN